MIVVTGLPRSGTSAMMRVLRAGGCHVLYDDVEPADVFNPHGYFEHSKAWTLDKDNSWMAGKPNTAVKVHYYQLPHLLATEPHKKIWVERNFILIAESHHRMAAAKKFVIPMSVQVYAGYLRQLEEDTLQKIDAPLIKFRFRETPLSELVEYLGMDLDVPLMEKESGVR